MSKFRFWLLVLLAFALPLRGAMAAAMLCPEAPAHGQIGFVHQPAGEHTRSVSAQPGEHASQIPGVDGQTDAAADELSGHPRST